MLWLTATLAHIIPPFISSEDKSLPHPQTCVQEMSLLVIGSPGNEPCGHRFLWAGLQVGRGKPEPGCGQNTVRALSSRAEFEPKLRVPLGFTLSPSAPYSWSIIFPFSCPLLYSSSTWFTEPNLPHSQFPNQNDLRIFIYVFILEAPLELRNVSRPSRGFLPLSSHYGLLSQHRLPRKVTRGRRPPSEESRLSGHS